MLGTNYNISTADGTISPLEHYIRHEFPDTCISRVEYFDHITTDEARHGNGNTAADSAQPTTENCGICKNPLSSPGPLWYPDPTAEASPDHSKIGPFLYAGSAVSLLDGPSHADCVLMMLRTDPVRMRDVVLAAARPKYALELSTYEPPPVDPWLTAARIRAAEARKELAEVLEAGGPVVYEALKDVVMGNMAARNPTLAEGLVEIEENGDGGFAEVLGALTAEHWRFDSVDEVRKVASAIEGLVRNLKPLSSIVLETV